MLKSKNYAVTVNGITYHMRAELHKSGAFQYGNGTTLIIYDGVNTHPWSYDTRYEFGIVSNWDKWIDKFIREWCDKSATIQSE